MVDPRITLTVLRRAPAPDGADLTAQAEAELATWDDGDGAGDGLLDVRRAGDGFVVYDGEGATPVERRASRQEALEFLVAIRGAVVVDA